mgnify:CR=1 FL=1
MKIVSLTDLKNNFGTLIDLVRRGKESLLVCERDIPIIKVIWAAQDKTELHGEDPGLLRRLERAGHLVRGEMSFEKFDIESLAVKTTEKVDLLTTLLQERDEGR